MSGSRRGLGFSAQRATDPAIDAGTAQDEQDDPHSHDPVGDFKRFAWDARYTQFPFPGEDGADRNDNIDSSNPQWKSFKQKMREEGHRRGLSDDEIDQIIEGQDYNDKRL